METTDGRAEAHSDTPLTFFDVAAGGLAKCLFDGNQATSLWWMPDGCFVYSGPTRVRFQPLCPLHEQTIPMEIGAELVADLDPAQGPTSQQPALSAGFTAGEVVTWLANKGLDPQGNPAETG